MKTRTESLQSKKNEALDIIKCATFIQNVKDKYWDKDRVVILQDRYVNELLLIAWEEIKKT